MSNGFKDEERLARALGGFSFGLGLPQVGAPGQLADAVGVGDNFINRAIMRAIGVRELASGTIILSQGWPVLGTWMRVAGDAMDISLLTMALTSKGTRKDRVVGALLSVLGVTVADVYASVKLTQGSGGLFKRGAGAQGIDVQKSVTVYTSPQDVYQFWRNFENLPRFMDHLQSVRTTGGKRSHWQVRGPAGTLIEWDAEITEDRPNELIAWRSLPGSAVTNTGTVRFVQAPGDRGTEIHVQLHYDVPGGAIAATFAKLFGEVPALQLEDELGRFKQVMETGEVVLSDEKARGGGPAQPPKQAPRQVPTQAASQPPRQAPTDTQQRTPEPAAR